MDLVVIPEGEQLKVDGRQLHMFLEVKTAYKDWFPRMCEYGFEEGKDFSSKLSESTGGRPQTNHLLSISMAKEIAMIQRNEKGKQARQYFIQIENEWNTPEKVIARGLLACKQMLETTKIELAEAKKTIELQQPDVNFAKAISGSDGDITVNAMAKILNHAGYKTGQNRLHNTLRIQGLTMRTKNGDIIPTQYSTENGWMRISENPYWNSTEGKTDLRLSTLITPKGQKHLIQRFTGKQTSLELES